jgi:hypothetical protein
MSSETRMSLRRIFETRTLLLLGLSAGCSDLLGLERPNLHVDDGAAGRGGTGAAGSAGAGITSGTGAAGAFAGAGHAAGGDAGDAAGGSAGEAAEGGEGGDVAAAGQGGVPASGGTAAGHAGATEAGFGGVAGHEAGRGGEGTGGAPFEWPVPGGPCSTDGALACREPESTVRYLCDTGRWIETTPCIGSQPFHELCDRRTGACTPWICEDPGQSSCSVDGISALVCGPDRVTLDLVTCSAGCDPQTGACRELSSRQLLLDRIEPTELEGRLWPDPLIPVCFRGAEPDADTLEAQAAVRLAVDTTWGRHSGASFQGWGRCSDEPLGVEIELVDDCSGELGHIPRPGHPGSEQSLPVELCRSYIDAEGVRQPALGEPTDLALLAFVAKHMFGHVLGRPDTYYDPPPWQMMARTLHLDTYSDITLSEGEIEALRYDYGEKPSQSLMAHNGRCLALASGEFTTEACDSSPNQRFQPAPSSLIHVETDRCVRLEGGNVTAGACTEEAQFEAFLPERVRWIALRGRCVSVLASPAAGESPLATVACDALWPADQAFTFEFPSQDSVRIVTASGSCVKWPEAWVQNAVPELGACGSRDLFNVRDGHLSRDGHCLYAPSSRVFFYPCSDFTDQHFSLSGAFELGGNALALVGTGDDAELAVLPVAFPPSPEQIFDYHF